MGQDISQIDSSEIQKMLQKFGKLDEDKSGALSANEFMQIPELTSNPLVERVIDIFDSDGNGEVILTSFIYLILDFLRLTSPNLFVVCLSLIYYPLI
jgi:serine/threonine-protein phosphatase 2B regulatory subunit